MKKKLYRTEVMITIISDAKLKPHQVNLIQSPGPIPSLFDYESDSEPHIEKIKINSVSRFYENDDEEFSKRLWMSFAKETLMQDQEDNANFKMTPLILGDLKEFVSLMEKVFIKEKEIESVLWTTVNPNGTEDKTWLRTFLYLKGYKCYKGMLKSLDRQHVKRIVKHFKQCGFQGV